MSKQIETISKEKVVLECMDCDAKETTTPEKFVIVRDHDEEFEAELMANGWTSTRGGAVCVGCHNSNPKRSIRNNA